MLTTEAAGLAVTIAKGLVKLTRQADLVLAEKEAVTSPMSLPVPELALEPFPEDMETALRQLLKKPCVDELDPIAKDRAKIKNLIRPGGDPSSAQMFPFIKKYLPEMEIRRSIDLNSDFMKTLKRGRPDWAADPELRVAAFYVHAGGDYRNKGYVWRLALTIVDVVAEFGAENTALFVRDKHLQAIIGAVLKRFGEADAQTADSTKELLRSVLSATLNGVIDARDHLDMDNDWITGLVDAIATARAKAAYPDNFLVGLVQGKGYPLLVGSVMSAASGHLGAGDADAFELTAANFLESIGEIITEAPTFDDFFKDHWGDLLRAGLNSVETYGPALLTDENPLLGKILSALAKTLATQPDNKFLTQNTLVNLVDTIAGTVAAHPDQVNHILSEAWLGALVNSVARTMSSQGIARAVTRGGLETMAGDVLQTFSRQPELIIREPGLARQLLGGILSSVSEVSVFNVETLAGASVAGALETAAAHPELLKFSYGDMVAGLAGKIAGLVNDKTITHIQGQDLIRAAMASLGENPALLMDLEKKVAAMVIDSVVAVAGEDAGALISDGLVTETVSAVLSAVAIAGKKVMDGQADEVKAQLKQVLGAGMIRAEAELGIRMGKQSLPGIFQRLVMAWAQGKIEVIDPENHEFITMFGALADSVQEAA